jgi:hypothetical protein
MDYKYFQAKSYGKGFLTIQESSKFFNVCYCGDIWIVENNEDANKWIRKINGVPLTKDQAQTIVNEKVTKAQQDWDAQYGTLLAQAENSEQEDSITVPNPRPENITLL